MTANVAWERIPLSESTAHVSVYAACDCDVCARPGARWFQCARIAARHVADYLCARRYVDCLATPHPDQVRWIEREHPGCVFVYLD